MTEERKHFCAALEYVLAVHRNLLESGRGHFFNNTGDCYTLALDNSPIIIIYQFTLTAGKMATVKAHQRNFYKSKTNRGS
jgi:hypothetical protein